MMTESRPPRALFARNFLQNGRRNSSYRHRQDRGSPANSAVTSSARKRTHLRGAHEAQGGPGLVRVSNEAGATV